MDLSTSSHHSAPNNTDADPELSPLEQEVLDEYAKLAGNLDNVCHPLLSLRVIIRFKKFVLKPFKLSNILSDLASKPSAEILDALRGLERSTTTVFTLLKASVYSIVLQQEIFGDEGQGEGGEGRTPGAMSG